MSTKTIYKRIALVAVSALTAGLVSVVAVPSANASAAVDSKFYIGTTNGVAGVADVAAIAGLRSTGLITSVTTNNGTTQTATLLSTGALAVQAGGLASTTNSIVVTGGRITATGEETGGATASLVNTARTVSVASAADRIIAAVVVPNAGATTMTIESYQGANVAAATPTNGTLIGRVTVTIAASDVTGVLDTANTRAWWNDGSAAASATTDATAANFNKANTESVNLSLVLRDAYNLPINAASAFVTATVTGGAKIALGTSIAPATTASTSVAYLAHSGLTDGIMYARISQGTANVAANFTVTIQYNGVTIATKSGVITGQVASFAVNTLSIGRTGASSADSFYFSFKDAAGNTVVPASQTSAVSVVSTTTNVSVTGATVTTPSTATAAGSGNFTCTGTTGAGVTGGASAKLQLQILDATSTAVRSNVFDAVCGGDAASFTASLDKASYTPGSIATLSIRFLDSRGNTPNDYTSFAASNKATFVGAPGTVVTDAAVGDKTVSGVKTYQFIVGTTEGDFNMVVDAPDVRTANIAAGGSQGKVTVAYKIAASSTATSNADVLKAIVSLIASINKQIAALQRALLRR
jgi:trimeric autotransporter adhesin